jgi:hypothetical protein
MLLLFLIPIAILFIPMFLKMFDEAGKAGGGSADREFASFERKVRHEYMQDCDKGRELQMKLLFTPEKGVTPEQHRALTAKYYELSMGWTGGFTTTVVEEFWKTAKHEVEMDKLRANWFKPTPNNESV